MSEPEEQKSGVSRRTVAKAMAWSVPAVALAVPAPAYAASPCTPVFSFGAASCKCPGGSDDIKFGYVLQFCVTVAAQCALPPGGSTAVISFIENNSGKDLVPIGDAYPIEVPVTVAPNCSDVVVLFESESSASSLLLTVSIDGAPSQVVEVPAPPQNCPSCNYPD
jgi:hypothetical protein